MAPSTSDPNKTWREDLALLEEFVAQRRKKQQQQQQYYYEINRQLYQPPKPHVYQVIVPVPATVKKEPVSVNCYEAAKIHGGTVIVDYPKTNKKTPMRMA